MEAIIKGLKRKLEGKRSADRTKEEDGGRRVSPRKTNKRKSRECFDDTTAEQSMSIAEQDETASFRSSPLVSQVNNTGVSDVNNVRLSPVQTESSKDCCASSGDEALELKVSQSEVPTPSSSKLSRKPAETHSTCSGGSVSPRERNNDQSDDSDVEVIGMSIPRKRIKIEVPDAPVASSENENSQQEAINFTLPTENVHRTSLNHTEHYRPSLSGNREMLQLPCMVSAQSSGSVPTLVRVSYTPTGATKPRASPGTTPWGRVRSHKRTPIAYDTSMSLIKLASKLKAARERHGTRHGKLNGVNGSIGRSYKMISGGTESNQADVKEEPQESMLSQVLKRPFGTYQVLDRQTGKTNVGFIPSKELNRLLTTGHTNDAGKRMVLTERGLQQAGIKLNLPAERRSESFNERLARAKLSGQGKTLLIEDRLTSRSQTTSAEDKQTSKSYNSTPSPPLPDIKMPQFPKPPTDATAFLSAVPKFSLAGKSLPPRTDKVPLWPILGAVGEHALKKDTSFLDGFLSSHGSKFTPPAPLSVSEQNALEDFSVNFVAADNLTRSTRKAFDMISKHVEVCKRAVGSFKSQANLKLWEMKRKDKGVSLLQQQSKATPVVYNPTSLAGMTTVASAPSSTIKTLLSSAITQKHNLRLAQSADGKTVYLLRPTNTLGASTQAKSKHTTTSVSPASKSLAGIDPRRIDPRVTSTEPRSLLLTRSGQSHSTTFSEARAAVISSTTRTAISDKPRTPCGAASASPMVASLLAAKSGISVSQNTSKYISGRPERKHKCPECSYQTDNRSHLRRHCSSVHSADKVYRCYVCCKDFSRSEKCKAHMVEHHPQVHYDPRLIRKETVEKPEEEEQDDAQTNEQETEGVKSSVQESCNKPVDSSALNLSSQDSEEEAVDLSLNRSSKESSVPSVVLRLQSSSPTPVKPSVVSIPSVVENMSPVTPDASRCHWCTMCEFRGSSDTRLKQHLRDVHGKVGSYLCKQCGYCTARKHRLVSHMKGHGSFSCFDCEFRTSSYCEFMTHCQDCPELRKSFNCSLCDRVFVSLNALASHQRQTHRPTALQIQCERCDFVASSPEHYRLHQQLKHFMGDSKVARLTDARAWMSSSQRLATKKQSEQSVAPQLPKPAHTPANGRLTSRSEQPSSSVKSEPHSTPEKRSRSGVLDNLLASALAKAQGTDGKQDLNSIFLKNEPDSSAEPADLSSKKSTASMTQSGAYPLLQSIVDMESMPRDLSALKFVCPKCHKSFQSTKNLCQHKCLVKTEKEAALETASVHGEPPTLLMNNASPRTRNGSSADEEDSSPPKLIPELFQITDLKKEELSD